MRGVFAMVVGVAALAGAAAGSAGAVTLSDPCLSAGGQLPGNVIAFSVGHGFRRYLDGIGSQAFRKQAPPAWSQLGAGKLCGADTVVAAATAARTDQARFWVLYRAFPARPSRAQWHARFGPLVLMAARSDTDALALISATAVDKVASQRASLHCGVPPNPPNMCDNETLPDTVAGLLANAKTEIDAVTADRAWLVKEAKLPWHYG